MILFNSFRNGTPEFIARLGRSEKPTDDERGISMGNVKGSLNTTYESDHDDVTFPVHRPPGIYKTIILSKEGGQHFI